MNSAETVELRQPITQFPSIPSRNEIGSMVKKIRDEFEKNFDRSWLAVVIDELPMDKRTVREIRDFLAVDHMIPENDHRLEVGVEELRRYIWTLEKHLLPNVKELLGVSPFHGARPSMDKSQFILRRLTAHALPYNLEQLGSLVDRLDLRFKELRAIEQTRTESA